MNERGEFEERILKTFIINSYNVLKVQFSRFTPNNEKFTAYLTV